MSLKRTFSVLGIGVLALAAAPTVVTAAEKIQQVFITNTDADPVPVQGVGTQQVGGTVNVGNLPAVQQVGGTVNVGNLPGTQEVSGAVEVTNLPQGSAPVNDNGSISLESALPRSMVIPDDVVLTDVVIERTSVSDADPCEVWLYKDQDGFRDVMMFFRPSLAQPFKELHLESGFHGGDERGFFVNSDCRARIFWTGYQLV